MSLIVTPRDLERRANFYHQLSQLLDAGIGLIQGLQLQRRHPPGPSYHAPLTRISSALEQGSTFAQALETEKGWVPLFDTALLQAGEVSGRLPACLTLLAKFYEQRASLMRSLISDLTYPALLLHMAILLGPFPDLVLTGNIGAYLRNTLSILVPFYVALFLLLSALQGRRGERWRKVVDRILGRVPILNSARKSLALARLSAALEALINAGVNIVEAWPMAAAASGSPLLAEDVETWQPELGAGRTPAELLAGSRQFPDVFSNLYRTGEISGRLDEALARLHAYYLEEGTRTMRSLARWLPKVVYLAIAALVAYRVVSFYVGYFGQIGDLLP